MKRKILEITEIDCGDTACDGCGNKLYYMVCGRFGGTLKNKRPAGEGDNAPLSHFTYFRLPECLEAERRYNETEKTKLPPEIMELFESWSKKIAPWVRDFRKKEKA
jgi:hypothetical protein